MNANFTVVANDRRLSCYDFRMRAYIFAIAIMILVLPVVVTAQAGGLVPCSGPDCTTESAVKLVNNVIGWLISALGVIAVIVMVYAGFKMVMSAGDEGAWTKAKELFTNVIIGIILILAAWLIVDTILKGLTGKGLDGWTKELTAPIPNLSNPSMTGGSNAAGAGQYTDAEARKALAAAGITVWESSPGATSLANINQATINEAVSIKQACGCQVIVTGGTESGVHASGQYSHSSGYKIDLDDTPGLNSYIMSNYTYVGPRSGDGALMYRSADGKKIYAKEGNHWDVLVQ